jgi:hypothetical protein
MEPRDREAQIGAALLLGLAVFVLIALASFYFHEPSQQLSDSVRENIAAIRR